MNILVTGGAGYIGSHMVHLLIPLGYKVFILDNLSTGYKKLIHPKAVFIQGDICNREFLENLLIENKIDSVLHFAAFIRVDESTREPYKYYNNNTYGSLQLFEACKNAKVKNIIFSSTAAVYGDGALEPITETSATGPKNPYGHSKLMSEQILSDIASTGTGDLRFAILRYFNVAGSHFTEKIGQLSTNSTHLIKVTVETAFKKREQMFIHGTDYPTADGTCVRDYIHVQDLVAAHYKALLYLKNGGKSDIFNLGYGRGYSVREVIDCVRSLTNSQFKVIEGPRREGDGAIFIADSSKAKKVLDWKPEFASLEQICLSSIEWEKQLV